VYSSSFHSHNSSQASGNSLPEEQPEEEEQQGGGERRTRTCQTTRAAAASLLATRGVKPPATPRTPPPIASRSLGPGPAAAAVPAGPETQLRTASSGTHEEEVRDAVKGMLTMTRALTESFAFFLLFYFIE